MSVKGVIVYLTQNNDVRKTYLKTSLYFLFRNFNAKYKYPIVICHEGDFDESAQKEILMGIRDECRNLLRFQTIDKEDFEVPSTIDQDRMNRNISLAPVPYWRNVRYRLMCRWWLRHLTKYVDGYDYVMRLDDDSIIEEPIEADLFELLSKNGGVYQSNILHVDCAICCYGMRDFFANKFGPSVDKFFQKTVVSTRGDDQVAKFIQTVDPEATKQWMVPIYMPLMFYNNFFMLSIPFWKSDPVQKLLDAIDENGGIFYYRWGDAPLQSLIVGLLSTKDKILKAVFRYSKRMQREVFVDDKGDMHSFMPSSYKLSSCVTDSQ